MYGVKLARELGDKGFTVVLLHPGYVKTVSSPARAIHKKDTSTDSEQL